MSFVLCTQARAEAYAAVRAARKNKRLARLEPLPLGPPLDPIAAARLAAPELAKVKAAHARAVGPPSAWISPTPRSSLPLHGQQTWLCPTPSYPVRFP